LPLRDHLVQFYESDTQLLETLTAFVKAGLTGGEAVVVLASADHRAQLEERLYSSGVGMSGALSEQRLVILDTAETLSTFMVDGQPDHRRFRQVIGDVLWSAARGGRRLRIFGEMIATLWTEGNRAGALRLGELWNEVARVHSFVLYCGYPAACAEPAAIEAIRAQHCRIIP
jgi:MEDS: MEthanogen/methylotroph, DcmR Sensory domain